jgi:signal transduction histidine kinase/ActR/RegA family two-component response regulator
MAQAAVLPLLDRNRDRVDARCTGDTVLALVPPEAGSLEGSLHVESLMRMLAHLREPLLLASMDGRILAANVASAEALGTSVEALQDAPLEVYSPDPAGLVAELHRSRPNRQFPLRARDGRLFTCDTSLLAPDLLLLRLSGGPDAGPRARAFFEAVSRFHGITSGDPPGGDEISRTLLVEGVTAVGGLAGGIYMLDESAAHLELKVAVQYPEPLADRYRLIPLAAKVPLVDTVKTMAPAFLGALEDFVAHYPDYAQAHPEIAQNAFVSLPLVTEGRCFGAISVGFPTPRHFTPEERGYLIALAAQCSDALERTRRADADAAVRRLAERSSQRLERLQAFSGALAQALTPAQVIEAVVDIGMATTSAQSGALWLLSPDGTSIGRARVVGPDQSGPEDLGRIPLDSPTPGPLLDALRGGVAVWIESRSQLEERYPGLMGDLPGAGGAALACLPLFAQGRPIGGLTYGFEGIHQFLADERAFLQVIAWYSAQALERARLYAAEKGDKERAEDNQRRSDFIADVGMLLASSLDYSNILSEVARAAVPRFADWCVLELVDHRLGGTPPVARHADLWKVPLVQELRRRFRELRDFSHGITSVMRSGVSQRHAWVSPEIIQAHFGADRTLMELIGVIGIASTLVVPISARGQVLGVMLLNRVDSKQPYDDQDLATAEELGRRIGLAVDNARLYQEARDRERLKDEFLAMLSHELRNPLGPIVLSLELMELEGGEHFAPERAMISRHVRHLVKIVDDLLDVARITRGKIELAKERCELASIIAGAVEMAGPLIEQRNHRLVMSSSGSGLEVIADPARLTHAVANLLTNAAKYTEPGGTITVNTTSDGNDAVVSVRDSGRGMAPDLIPRIFEPFVQGPSTLDRSQGGLGIGLTVVKNVVTLHGGTVSAHSAGAGHGSEFVIRVPRIQPTAAPATAASSGDGRCPAGDGCRVLAVDDNHDAAALIGRALEGLGCSVLVVHDGPSALASVAAFRPQLVLLDIGLPGMDGYAVARRLRESDLEPSPRIVAVTGYGQPSDRARSHEAGFDDHIVKPLTLETLNRVLGQCPGVERLST